MITCHDPEYVRTRKIKKGEARLAPPFDQLASWISDTWHVNVPNVMYFHRDGRVAPRLQVVLEFENELRLPHVQPPRRTSARRSVGK